MKNTDLMDKIVSLCKRRGFVFPGSEIYGGLANSWDYGPLGVELKNNIKQLWWKRFVQGRDDMVGIDTAVVMNPKVWEASGHTGAGFADPLIECKKCHSRYRADQFEGDTCPSCGGKEFTEPKMFNILMETSLGSVEGDKNTAYLRGETAQGMFVNFKNILDSSRKKLPFGIAQQGKAFRNEITPGNFIFRTREFEQMEIEYFIPVPKTDEDWNKYFEEWREAMMSWMTEDLGLKKEHIHELEVEKDSLAHYSKRTVDFEYEFPFGTKELYGLAYRTDFDLANHQKHSGENLEYFDQESGEKFTPHCIEPTWGVDRSILALLSEHYDDSNPEHIVLHLPKALAPYKAAVFPLVKNKPEIVELAKGIYSDLRKDFLVAWDDRGNVGKRYYSQDEIGTPVCITVDYQTLEDGTVTVRDRDTGEQTRVSKDDIKKFLV